MASIAQLELDKQYAVSSEQYDEAAKIKSQLE